jgi:hypothetical protein
MSFADLASLGSFVSGIGVLVSLIYLSLQIRQNTRAVRSQIHQHIADSWLSLGAILSDHSREFTAALKADEKAFAAMPDDEKYAFLSCIFVFFKHFENIYTIGLRGENDTAMVQGQASFFVEGEVGSGAKTLRSIANGLAPAADALVRIVPRRTVWWKGWSSGSARAA